MKKSTMVALGCGAGAVACIALAVHFKKRRQTGGAVACGVVGGCAAAVAAGCTVCALRKRDALRLEEQKTPLLTKLGEMSRGNRFEAFQRFDTIREVVEAFAITYNDDSIRNNREYGATIYKDRDGKYYYSTPNEGTEANIWMYTLPENKEDDVVALVHSHGSTTSHDNENLSKDDISTADNYQIPVYVVTPGGKIQKYDPKGERTRINAPSINPAIPSDPNAGNDRLTEVDPSAGVDNPSVPKHQQVEPPPNKK